MAILFELFHSRRELVESYFTCPEFSQEDAKQLLHIFNTTPASASMPKPGTPQAAPQPAAQAKSEDFGYHFSPAQLDALHDYLAEHTYITPRPTREEVASLFQCTLTTPLRAANNREVARLFHALSQQGYLCRNWQAVIEQHRLIASSATARPITARELASALNAVMQSRQHPRNQREEEHLRALCLRLESLRETATSTRQ